MECRNWIDGQQLGAEGGGLLPVIDPSTGETFARLAQSSEVDIDWAVQAARRACQGPWSRLTAAQRSQLLLSAPNRPGLHEVLDRALGEIYALPEARKVRWSLDVDPVDLY